MSTFYRVTGIRAGLLGMRSYEVERSTATSVWVNGRREARTGDGWRWFESEEQARNFIIAILEWRRQTGAAMVESAEEQLRRWR